MSTELATYQNPMYAPSIFTDEKRFEMAGKMAATLAKSTIVPKEYQGNACNAMIAIEMAERLRTSPIMVMQNLDIIYGRPAWRSQYVIAMINASGRFKTPLMYEITGTVKDGTLSCYAWAETRDGHRVEGPVVDWQMVKSEGWLDKNGSKWKTMPLVMIRYRAAKFFANVNCPDLIMGLMTNDEIIDVEYREVGIANAEINEANSIEFEIPEPSKANEGHKPMTSKPEKVEAEVVEEKPKNTVKEHSTPRKASNEPEWA